MSLYHEERVILGHYRLLTGEGSVRNLSTVDCDFLSSFHSGMPIIIIIFLLLLILLYGDSIKPELFSCFCLVAKPYIFLLFVP